MLCQIISIESEPGMVKFAGLISLPSQSVESDLLFDPEWGANMIRPSGKLSGNELVRYIEEAKEILKNLKTEFDNVAFIDLRIEDNVSFDVDISYFNYISYELIGPVLKNFEWSNIKFARNGSEADELISKISSITDGIHAFSCTIAKSTFDQNSVIKGLTLFEETKIFAHLALTGELK
ncbi:hypothetical protein D3C87_1238840 [compost metagenome]